MKEYEKVIVANDIFMKNPVVFRNVCLRIFMRFSKNKLYQYNFFPFYKETVLNSVPVKIIGDLCPQKRS